MNYCNSVGSLHSQCELIVRLSFDRPPDLVDKFYSIINKINAQVHLFDSLKNKLTCLIVSPHQIDGSLKVCQVIRRFLIPNFTFSLNSVFLRPDLLSANLSKVAKLVAGGVVSAPQIEKLRLLLVQKNKHADLNGPVFAQLFFCAIHSVDEKCIDFLLDEGLVDPTVRDGRGYQGIHVAVEESKLTIFSRLFELESCDQTQKLTALCLAASLGSLAFIRFIFDSTQPLPKFINYIPLDHPRNTPEIDLDLLGVDGFNCLHLAASNGHETVVKEILEYKSLMDPEGFIGFLNAKSRSKQTALELACIANKPLVVSVLIQFRAMIPPSLLSSVIGFSDVAVVEHLLEGGALVESKDATCETPLFYAVKTRSGAAVSLLLGRPYLANIEAVNLEGLRVCHYVAILGNLAILGHLIQAEFDVDATTLCDRRFTILQLAAHEGFHLFIEAVLVYKRKKSPSTFLDFLNAENGDGESALTITCSKGHFLATASLLSAGARVDPIHLLVASKSGNTMIIQLLLDTGLPIDVAGEGGFTPFLLATYAKHSIAVKILSHPRRSANLEAQTDEGYRAIHLSAIQADLPTLEVLLDRRVDVNAVSCNVMKCTALHLVSYHSDNSSYVEALLGYRKKMDPVSFIQFLEQENWQGDTALILAAEKGHLTIAKTLVAFGAVIPPDTLSAVVVYGEVEVVEWLLSQQGVELAGITEQIKLVLVKLSEVGNALIGSNGQIDPNYADDYGYESACRLYKRCKADFTSILDKMERISILIDREAHDPLFFSEMRGKFTKFKKPQ